jgi:hypothetical protein
MTEFILQEHVLLPRHIAEKRQPERLVLALDGGRLIGGAGCVPNILTET